MDVKTAKKTKVIINFKNIITFEVLRIVMRCKGIKSKTLHVEAF